MRVGTAKDAAELLAPLLVSATEERVVVLHLGPERRLLGLTLEQTGSAEDVEMPVRAILSSVLRLGGEALIVAHNHPSGDPRPSGPDRSATRLLGDAATSVNVRLLDHLIFAGGEWRSFVAEGFL